MKLSSRIEWPAAIVASVGFLCVTAAFVWGPPEYRAQLVAGIGAVWGLLQTLLPKLLKEAA